MKYTPLYKWHADNKATLSPFGDYEMPLWYSAGAKEEHLSVLTNAGIFDTSHMAAIIVEGAGSYKLIQKCFSKNLDACIGKNNTSITPGRCTYGVFLDEKGFVIDDSLVYMIADNFYMVVVNSGMGAKIAGQLAAQEESSGVSINDMTDKIGKMDIQGPFAGKILKKLIKSPESVFENLPYFSFKGYFEDKPSLSGSVCMSDGTPLMISRTGYTGEFGFEIFIDPAHIQKLWEMLLESGKEYGILPCGLAARDSLRAGAILPLSHQDIGHWPFLNNPWLFALPLESSGNGFTKDFIGKVALEKTDFSSHTQPFVGYDLRKIGTHEKTAVKDESGNIIGRVLTCVSDMGISRDNGKIFSISSPDKPAGFNAKGLCCGFVLVDRKIDPGTDIIISDDKRQIKVTVVEDVRPDRTARKPLKEMI